MSSAEAPTLQALQQRFQQHLLHGGDEPDATLAADIAPGGIGVARRLRVYHQAYRARLVDALRDTFGHTARYLGDDGFERDARAFIDATPSHHASLNDYGAGLPAWWAQRFPADPDIAELAQLDWALRRAFDGADAPVLGLADLAGVAPDAWAHIGFRLHPTVRRLRVTRNTAALWAALDAEQAPPPAEPLDAELLVWRLGQQPHFRTLGPMEAEALAALQDGLGFAALCEQLARKHPQADGAREAGALLRRWVDDGLLSEVTHPSP